MDIKPESEIVCNEDIMTRSTVLYLRLVYESLSI